MNNDDQKSNSYQYNMEFVELYTKYQKNIFYYIISMVCNHSDAEDILQDTARDMWKMFDRYQEGTNFLNWAITIAKFRVLKFRRSQKKYQILDDVLIDKIVDEIQLRAKNDDRQIALEGCLKRLSEIDRKLLSLHYDDGMKYRSIAKQINYAERRIYTVMSRIHLSLRDCVAQTLKLWREAT